ncbi:MAG: RibD family protein [Acidobacteriia bacterium]|nr:RibD family protein [Terriglobia bacterium]
MELIRTLLDRQVPASPPALPEGLRTLYGGDLCFPGSGSDRPHVIGNFVSTLDGIVSFAVPGKAGGGDISGFNSGDRFIMGLLRASADAVMVGAATLDEVSQSHLFVAESIYRAASDSYALYRREILHKPRYPLTVIVTGRGNVDLRRAVFRTPDVRTVILTTEEGRARLAAAGAASLPSTEVRVIQAPGSRLPAGALLELLSSEYNVRLLLHEGGPTLFGSLVAEGLVDEFFLTLAPQLAGRTPESVRPGMIAGIEFLPGAAPWLELFSVRQCGDHLYLRYRKRDVRA